MFNLQWRKQTGGIFRVWQRAAFSKINKPSAERHVRWAASVHTFTAGEAVCRVSFDRGWNGGDWLSVKINKGVDFVWNMPSHYFELTSFERVLESRDGSKYWC